MNKDRRIRLNGMVGQIEQLIADLEAVRDEEQDARDNLPQSIQDGERGEAMLEAIDSMETALGQLEDAKGYIEDLANG